MIVGILLGVIALVGIVFFLKRWMVNIKETRATYLLDSVNAVMRKPFDDPKNQAIFYFHFLLESPTEKDVIRIKEFATPNVLDDVKRLRIKANNLKQVMPPAYVGTLLAANYLESVYYSSRYEKAELAVEGCYELYAKLLEIPDVRHLLIFYKLDKKIDYLEVLSAFQVQ